MKFTKFSAQKILKTIISGKKLLKWVFDAKKRSSVGLEIIAIVIFEENVPGSILIKSQCDCPVANSNIIVEVRWGLASR